jgi:hypothetical protein
MGAQQQQETPSRLGKVRTGTIPAGLRFVFYGPEAVGKSSLAAAAPAPIFIDCEDGTEQLDVARYSFRDEPHGHVPRNVSDIVEAIRDLRSSDHGYKSVVIDTVDRIEPMLWQMMIERDSGKRSGLNQYGQKLVSIESYGFGKGYQVAVDEWRKLAVLLDDLRVMRGMNIILLGHAVIRTFKNPTGEDYDRWQLRVNEKGAAFLKGWSDIVGFCTFEETGARLDESDQRTRPKGVSTGRRLMKLERTAAYDGKSRIPMPPQLELKASDPWSPLGEAIQAGRNIKAPQLIEKIQAELVRVGADEDFRGKVEKAIADAKGDVAVLSRYLNEIQRRDSRERA